MAALSLVAYLFFRLPFYGGSSFHLGNTFTALTALLDGVSGGLAGAIGLALADILAGDPGYAVTTFVLKFLIGICCGAVAHKLLHLRAQDPHSKGYLLLKVRSCRVRPAAERVHRPSAGVLPQRVHLWPAVYCGPGSVQGSRGVTLVNSIVSTICAHAPPYCALPWSVPTCCPSTNERSAPVAKQQIFRSF